MATLAKLLQVEMGLPEMAKRLAAAGRGKDSILAHINPKEAKLLKKHGGKGSTNPNTGIMEFDDTDYSDNGPTPTDVAPSPPTDVAPPPPASAPDQSQAETTNRMGSTLLHYPSGGAPDQSQAPTVNTGVDYSSAPDQSQAETNRLAFYNNAPQTQQPVSPGDEPSYADRFATAVKPYAKSADTITKALDPFMPYGKVAFDLYSQYQQRKASEEADAKAADNQARLEALATPYRDRAAQVAQQGQALVQAGQAGQLTADQQQKLEAARAQTIQQASASGMDTGTAGMQTEAQLARIAAQFATDNVNQGIALINQANTISGQADAIITGAINTGYAQSADATKLAQNYAKNIGYQLPQTQSKGPT